MNVRLTYRGRAVTDADVALIHQIIAAHPTASRRTLSKKLCEAWNWVQPNGMPRDWQQLYGHPVYFLETFVDPQRFRGTCYYAANWTYLGRTTGRGKDDQTNKPNRPIKDVLGYPLCRDFRERLGHIE